MRKSAQRPRLRRIRRLVLRGQSWRIRWPARIVDADTGGPLLGLCDRATSTISIARRQPPGELADTFIHEIIHALFPRAKESSVRRGASELLAALRRAGLTP